MASNTECKISGTTVWAHSNKATRQKGGNQKAFYSSFLELNTASLKTDRRALHDRANFGSWNWKCDRTEKRVVETTEKLQPKRASSNRVTDCVMGGGGKCCNTRGQWLWFTTSPLVVFFYYVVRCAGGKLSGLQPSFTQSKTRSFIGWLWPFQPQFKEKNKPWLVKTWGPLNATEIPAIYT